MLETFDILKSYIIKPKGMFIWRDIPGWEGRYQISNHGDVCSITNRMIGDTNVHLINEDKTIKSISVVKLLNGYWKKQEQYQGDEQWRKIDHYNNYFISNYGNVKNCRRLVLFPNKKTNSVVLTKRVNGKIVRKLSLIHI